MSIQFSNLKMYRMKAGLTQEEIAEKIGVSRQAVAKWERGETQPAISSCISLAELYDISVDSLVRNMNLEAAPNGDSKHFFGVVKVNDKGQITLPAECRRVFGLSPGTCVLVLGDEEKGGIALVNVGEIEA